MNVPSVTNENCDALPLPGDGGYIGSQQLLEVGGSLTRPCIVFEDLEMLTVVEE